MPISPARIAAASIASWNRCESCTRAAPRPFPAVTWAGIARHEMTVSSGTLLLRRRAEIATGTTRPADRERPCDEAGVHAAVSEDGFRRVYFQGHPEYDANSLLKEYKREVLRHLLKTDNVSTAMIAPSAERANGAFGGFVGVVVLSGAAAGGLHVETGLQRQGRTGQREQRVEVGANSLRAAQDRVEQAHA